MCTSAIPFVAPQTKLGSPISKEVFKDYFMGPLEMAIFVALIWSHFNYNCSSLLGSVPDTVCYNFQFLIPSLQVNWTPSCSIHRIDLDYLSFAKNDWMVANPGFEINSNWWFYKRSSKATRSTNLQK